MSRFKRNKSAVGGKEECFLHAKKRTLRSSLSLPDDIVWETTLSSKTSSLSLPLTSILFPASHCLLFFFALLFLLFLFQTAFGTLQTGGSSCPIVSFEKDEEINPSLFLSLSPSPSLFLSLPLRLSPSPPPVTEHTCLILAAGVHTAISSRPAVLLISSSPLWICGCSSLRFSYAQVSSTCTYRKLSY